MTQPQQYALVPREPTSKQVVYGAGEIRGKNQDGMICTGDELWLKFVSQAEKSYDAMLRAAPPPPEQVLSDEEINEICGWTAANTTMRAENDRQLVRDAQRAVLQNLGAKNGE